MCGRGQVREKLSWRTCPLSMRVATALAIAVGFAACGAASQTPSVLAAPAAEEADLRAIAQARVAVQRNRAVALSLFDAVSATDVYAGSVSPGGAAVDEHAVFEIGSLTKTLTGALLADMVLNGEVSYDEPVQKFLPADVHLQVRGRPITLLDLATHRSGLPRLGQFGPAADPENPFGSIDAAELYAFLRQFRPERAPEAQFEYSNTGVGLLGHVLARRAGQSYEALLRERLLTPLGMNETGIALRPELEARLVDGWTDVGYPTAHWTLPALAGAGAIRSTLHDMRIYLRALMHPDASRVGRALREAAAVKWHGPSGETVALAWFHGVTKTAKGQEVPRILHFGATAGFKSYAIWVPGTGRAAVVLASGQSAHDLADYALFGLALGESTPRTPRIAIELTGEQRQAVVGHFRNPEGQVIEIASTAHGLMVSTTPGEPALPLFAESPRRFFVKMADIVLEPVSPPDQLVTEWRLLQDGTVETFTRVAQ